jgi:hypothetical protein
MDSTLTCDSRGNFCYAQLTRFKLYHERSYGYACKTRISEHLTGFLSNQRDAYLVFESLCTSLSTKSKDLRFMDASN